MPIKRRKATDCRRTTPVSSLLSAFQTFCLKKLSEETERKKVFTFAANTEHFYYLKVSHKMSKAISFLPWAMRMVIILFLITTLIQQDILLYIISSLNLLLIIFCIWGFVKSKAQGIMKALRGNRAHNVFDVVISVLFIITGLCTKDTTMIIEGGLLLIIAISNYRRPEKLFPN